MVLISPLLIITGLLKKSPAQKLIIPDMLSIIPNSIDMFFLIFMISEF